ncbi:MAG TPA: NDP-sugar synthase, partial [Actinocrinis sp.]
VEQSYWRDLGTPEAFARGSADLVLAAVESPAVPSTARPDLADALVLPGAALDADVKVGGGSTIGANARIASGAEVTGSVIGEGAHIEAGVVVRDSIVGRGASVGPGTVLDGVVIGDGASVGARNELRGGTRVWCDAVIGDGAVRFSADEF